MNGIIVVNKHKNCTSRDIINELNNIFNIEKIGHTGTLDPIATGVLVVCIGKYTKLANELTSLNKEYQAEVKLGIKTDTLDITGKIVEEQEYNITKENLIKTLNSFLGNITQTTPLYSAVSIKGKRLYQYAFEGKEIELPKREVTINSIELIDFKKNSFTFKTNVSKGTYIRSLIDDICVKLDTVGTMKNLTRTKQGIFDIKDSYTIEDIKNNNYKLLNAEDIFDYEVINLTEEEYFRVKNGNTVVKELSDNNYILKYDNNIIIAIYEFSNNIGKIKYMLN